MTVSSAAPAAAPTAVSPADPEQDTIVAQLKYLADADSPPMYKASVGGGDSTVIEGNYVMQPVRIHNARAHAAGGHLSLDKQGFVLVPHSTAVANFYDDAELERVYNAEVEALVQAATGAARVHVFDHTRRSASKSVQESRGIREPAVVVHNDYTAKSAAQRLQDLRPQDVSAGRWAIINCWRSTAGTVYDDAMAFCDASTVSPEHDLVSVTRQARDRTGELQQAVYRPAHTWYYFPRLHRDEALLFKTFDSAEEACARFTPHTSFQDPNAPETAPPRESIETRCFVFF